MQAAIKLGTRFYRVAAAGVPPAAAAFEPHPRKGKEDCVTCCDPCGCPHKALVDEYYFWLVDGAYYQPPQTPVPTSYQVPPTDTDQDYQEGYQNDFYDPSQQEAALWQDTSQLPKLLYWQASPLVRLAWCRVRDGAFQEPRQSDLGVAITTGAQGDLTFLGRNADSLYFSVSNAVTPDGYSDPSPPGFRYDLATDEAVSLPLPIPPAPPPSFPATLPAYPYFLYDTPGTHLFPLSAFSPALAVARTLRAHCRFEAALDWYRLAFDPLHRDCTWIECDPKPSTTKAPSQPANGKGEISLSPSNGSAVAHEREGNCLSSLCCDASDICCKTARHRAVVLHYLETLVEWGDAVRRRHNAPEAFEQARVIFDAAQRILGKSPREVRAPSPRHRRPSRLSCRRSRR